MPVIRVNSNTQSGLVKANPIADLPKPIETPKIASPAYKGVAVDMRWVDRTDLLTHVEGSSWVVDYFSQVLDTDSQLSGQQVTVSPVYQQYKCIRRMELKVQSPLSSSQVDDTKGMEMMGTSIVYPFLIPNEGDMFVADLGEGIRGVFRVKLTTKKSIYKQACYEIEYSLDTDQSDKMEDLVAKTVETVYFHKDFIAMGKNPLLVKSKHDALLNITEVYETLSRQYFKRFFSNEFKTMLVPGQELTTYDPFVVDFLLKQFSTEECPELRFVRELHMGGDMAMQADNLWTALAERNANYMRTAFHKAGVVTTRVFASVPLNNSIRYTGIARAVYPLDAQLVVRNNTVNSVCPTTVDSITPGNAPVGGLYKMVQAVNVAQVDGDDEGTVPVAFTDDYYVLSQAFYERTVPMTDFEDVVWQYLERKPMDVESLVGTANLWMSWGEMEKFYFIPILMQMMRSVIRGEQ